MLWLAVGLIFAPVLRAATIEEARALFVHGDYAGAIAAAAAGAHEQPEEAAWPELQAEALDTLRPADRLELFTDGHAYPYYRAQILAESLGLSPA